jgi:hypothetical protein
LVTDFVKHRSFSDLFSIFTKLKGELWAVLIAVVEEELHEDVRTTAPVALADVTNLRCMTGWQT